MEGFITINDLKIGYQKIERSDKAIIFLHHNSGSAAVWDGQWNDSRFDAYTLIRIDLPGQGRSSYSIRPEKDYNLPGMGHVLAEAVEHLDIGDYVIATLSISGNIAGEAAHQLTGCKGFFMTGASVIGEGITPADILLPFEYGAVLFEENPRDDELKNYIQGLVFSNHDNTLADLIAWYRHTDPLLRSALGQSIAAGKWTDEIHHLEISRKPVVLVYGENERIINRNYIQKASDGKWRDNIKLLDKAGHLANLDQPDEFNRLLLEFAGETLK
jgi:pimeloyl-ACP methyl ester carboxylesterase